MRLILALCALVFVCSLWANAATTPHTAPAKAPASETVLCLKCHAAPGLERPRVSAHKPPLRRIDPREFAESAHGRYLGCTDCHTPHKGEPLPSQSETVAKLAMVSTCSRCHVKEGQEFQASIHAKALREGKPDAPACFNCHGEHNIRPPRQAESTVSPARIPETCSSCHENTTIQKRYDLPPARLETYQGSYHGIAVRFGQLEAANCASCHGYHRILPSSDPASPISKANLPRTCGKCHPGATRNFAVGTIHLQPTSKQEPVVYWVALIYRTFVTVLITGFCVMIVLDLTARARTVLRSSRQKGAG
ncbi:MAG: hypothetical protein ACUVTZ_01560 [Armatimonadota bacterium]